MRTSMMISLGSCLLLATGCTEGRLTDVAAGSVSRRAWSQGRGLVGSGARALAAREASRRASLGDRAMLEKLAGDTATTVRITAASATTTMNPDDPSTWGKTTILSAFVIASIRDYQFVYASMMHDGHFGHIDLRWNLTGGANGSELFTDWQPGAWPLEFSHFTASIPLTLGHQCGRTLTATGAFSSYWGPLPEIRISRFTIPSIRFGLSSYGATGTDAEEPCPEAPPPGDGTTGGDADAGGHDGYYTQEVCLYYDWYYPDGTYWYTETIDCWLVYTSINET
jgi:hypothetical protein